MCDARETDPVISARAPEIVYAWFFADKVERTRLKVCFVELLEAK